MGNKSSKSKSNNNNNNPPPANSKILELKTEKKDLTRENTSLENERIPTAIGNNTSQASTNALLWKQNDEIVRQGGEDKTALDGKIDTTNININNIKNIDISNNIGFIKNTNDDINDYYNEGNVLKENTILNYLYDIDTVQNTYYSILNQNNNINYYNSQIDKNSYKNIQKNNYVSEQIGEMDIIESIFFVIYYLLFLIFCYVIIFKRKLSVTFKIILIIITLVYPIIIFFIESGFYNLMAFLYLYVFSIYRIENID
jgi:hypothetical protein